MKLKQLNRSVAPFLLCAAFLLCFAPLADAHMYFSFPADAPSASTGMTDVYTTFALDPPAPDEGMYDANKYDTTGRVVAPDGSETAVTDFLFGNSKTRKSYTSAELQAMTPEQIKELGLDSKKSSVGFGDEGTYVFLTETDFEAVERDGGATYTLDFDCTSKAFVNMTDDKASTKQYFATGLELVPLDDLADAVPGSVIKVKAYLNNQPAAGLGIFVTYEGCANYALHGETSALRLLNTGEDGTVEIALPSRPGKTYLYATYTDMALSSFADPNNMTFVGNMASVSFETTVDEAESEVDVADRIFAAGDNAAAIGTPVGLSAEMVDFIGMLGFAWANDLINVPTGASSFVSGLDYQLPGIGTGVTFEMPMDNTTGSPLAGAIGTEQNLTLTSAIVGEDTIYGMIDFLKNAYVEDPAHFQSAEGLTFYTPYSAKDFFSEFNIYIMAGFGDGVELDMSDNFMLGVIYDEDEFEAGRITIVYGTLFADSLPVDGSYVYDLTPLFDPEGLGMNKAALIYDGAADDNIQMTYWLARSEPYYYGYDSGSSGCSAGLPLRVLLISALGLFVGAKKRD